MKTKISYIIVLMMSVNVIFAQDTIPEKTEGNNVWHENSAKVLKQGRTESGLFAPMRIGLKNQMELSVHPIWFFVMPNAKLKKNWTLNDNNKFQVASEHGFTFPTILLNLLAKNGTGGIFPADQKAPAILTLNNKVIMSYFYHPDHSVSLKLGMEFNALASMYNGFAPVELLIAYPRTASYSRFYTGEIALAFSGTFVKKVGYDGDIKLFLIPDDKLTWVLEWNPKVYYNVSDKFRIMAGALVTTGNIPHEKAAVRAIPVFDLQYSFNKSKKKKKK